MRVPPSVAHVASDFEKPAIMQVFSTKSLLKWKFLRMCRNLWLFSLKSEKRAEIHAEMQAFMEKGYSEKKRMHYRRFI
ncbi:hypothetical protein BC351_28190 [Paenibacillus ferrarius]|uniref:Uncharacterized protein n=1 Tax=Paenibacillus ferrarius TaxID=1469647 RepID=A0A1V4HIC3_9BACL|nr:hypothetical protein BC351_28190 [Paenibacillus ferrarius]